MKYDDDNKGRGKKHRWGSGTTLKNGDVTSTCIDCAARRRTELKTRAGGKYFTNHYYAGISGEGFGPYYFPCGDIRPDKDEHVERINNILDRIERMDTLLDCQV